MATKGRRSRACLWTNEKKFGKRQFQGSYETTRGGDRTFELVAVDGKRTITCESYQMAMQLGWRKV